MTSSSSPSPSPSPSTPILATVIDIPTDAPSEMTVAPFQRFLNWDKDVSYVMYRKFNSPRLPHLILEISGHGVPWLVIPVLFFLLKSTLSPIAAALLLNFLALTIIDLIVIGILKPLFHRQRPAYNSGIGHVTIHVVDQFSFPSGHSTRAAFLASFVCYVRANHSDGLHPVIDTDLFTIAVFVWAAAICASRVALGRHHVLDVICGAIIGASYVFFWNPLWITDRFADALRQNLRSMLPFTARLASLGPEVHSYL